MLNEESLRLLIRRKLADRLLPHDGISAGWSSPSDGEKCDARDTVLSKDHLPTEAATPALGRKPLQMHVRCFQIWDQVRRAA